MRSKVNYFDKLKELDFELFLQNEGIKYRRTVGKSGRELNIKECPICGNSHYKVYFNPKSGVGVCFAGSHPQDEQLNKFVFLRAYSGLKGPDLRKYIDRLMLEQGWRPQEPEKPLERDLGLTNDITLPFHYKLPTESGELPQYLIDRNINAELCDYFDIRLCVDGKHAYVDPETDRVYSQDFSKRILIPVYDLDKKMRTFQGRDITGNSEKKYLFPSRLPASGRFLYNGYNAIGKPTVVVVEGVFDCWSVKRALMSELSLRDYVEPICTFGMHLSGSISFTQEDQLGTFLKLKHRGLKNIILMWDTEQQAIANTIKAAEKLTSIGLNVKIAFFDRDGQDAGDSSNAEIIKSYFKSKAFNKMLALKMRSRGINGLRD